jgi:hypothetical protein
MREIMLIVKGFSRLHRAGKTLEPAKIFHNLVRCAVRHPRASRLFPPDAANSRSVFSVKRAVSHVYGLGYVLQIGNPIVDFHAVNVVNLVLWPSPMAHRPYDVVPGQFYV